MPSAGKTPTSRAASPAQPPPGPPVAADAWNLDLLEAAVPTRQTSPLANVRAESPVDDLFDLGFDGTRFAPTATTSTSMSPAAAPSTDEFNLLDAFAEPAQPAGNPGSANQSHLPAPRRQATADQAHKEVSSATPRTQTSTIRPDSPPPHVVGQLVEMGFDPAAATAALAATRSSGTADWSVDAALEVLVQQQEDEEVRRRKQREADEWGDDENIRIGRRRSWQRDNDGIGPAGADRPGSLATPFAPPTARPEADDRSVPARTAPVMSRSGAGPSRVPDGHDLDTTKEQAKVLQEQANEVLAQAQKIGLSMFKSANAYWGEGKKALQKAIDEQRAAARAGAASASAGGGTGGPPNGKPRWWREGMDGEDEEGTSPAPGAPKGKGRAEEALADGFKDSDNDHDELEPATRTRLSAPGRAVPSPSEAPPAAEYRSPYRRAKPAPAAATAPAEADLLSELSSSPAPSLATRSPSQRAPPPSSRSNIARGGSASPRPPAPKRQHVAVPASALVSASRHKEAGTDHFKLGRFSDATASFTLALNALPEDWIGCVPLLNNRAQARLRSGEEKAAAADCSAALSILLAPTQSACDLASLEAESAALPAEVGQLFSGGATIDLKDQLGKSLARRAKANEANEKWALACEDWQKLLTLGDDAVTRGAGGIKMISDGVARCKQMLDGPAPARSKAGPPRPPAAPGASTPSRSGTPRKPAPPIEGSGEAVRALQAQQAALAAEDDLRLQLKDQVDAQIAAWKGGKETNLRALIASLDAVLWPGLGWKTVGMHELISENQLKVRYVRAIAKVHPDKVSYVVCVRKLKKAQFG